MPGPEPLGQWEENRSVITNNPRNMNGSTMNGEHLIRIICNDPGLTRKYVNELQSASQSFQLRPIAWFAGVRQRPRVEASVFLLDESGLEDQSKEGLQATVTELVEIAPVIMVAASQRQPELKSQISALRRKAVWGLRTALTIAGAEISAKFFGTR